LLTDVVGIRVKGTLRRRVSWRVLPEFIRAILKQKKQVFIEILIRNINKNLLINHVHI